MKPLCRVAALAACLAGTAQAGLPSGLEGSWYNPPQSGHGLTIERIDPERALLFWHVFDPEGRPLTLYIEASLEGDRLVGTALAPMGMRFGSFVPAELELPEWGEVSLEFLDCNQAVLRYDAVAPGYGAGEMPLTRLLPPRDPHCSLTAASDLQGLRDIALVGNLVFPEPLQQGYGESAGLVGGIASNGLVLAKVQAFPVLILEGRPGGSAPGQVQVDWRVLENTWSNALFGDEAERVRPVRPLLEFSAPIELSQDGSRGSAFHFPEASHSAPSELRLHFRPLAWPFGDPPPGRYIASVADPTRTDDPAGLLAVEVLLPGDGSLCLRLEADAFGGCLMQGRATQLGPDLYDIELSALDPAEPPYTGLARFGSYSLIVVRRYFVDLQASNGIRGLSINAVLRENQP